MDTDVRSAIVNAGGAWLSGQAWHYCGCSPEEPFRSISIQDAVCTWCSMKWTLLEHQQSIKEGLHRALPPTNTNQAEVRITHRQRSTGP